MLIEYPLNVVLRFINALIALTKCKSFLLGVFFERKYRKQDGGRANFVVVETLAGDYEKKRLRNLWNHHNVFKVSMNRF